MEQKPAQSGMNKHMLLMVLCCAIPLALLAAVNIFRVDLGSIGYFAIVLMCPLMHLVMMRGMGHDHSAHQTADGQSCHSTSEQATATAVDIPTRGNGKVKVGIER